MAYYCGAAGSRTTNRSTAQGYKEPVNWPKTPINYDPTQLGASQFVVCGMPRADKDAWKP
jgi:hypothetical protein